jgi:hypothetical protein
MYESGARGKIEPARSRREYEVCSKPAASSSLLLTAERSFMIHYDVNHAAAVDEATSRFQPDSLLPVQYFENFRREIQTDPEKRLMLAVLEDALTCFQKHYSSRGGRGLRLFRETEEWIFREDSGRLFSFGNICEVVDVDPQYVRRGLLRWKKMRPRVNMLEKPGRRLQITRSRMVGLRG